MNFFSTFVKFVFYQTKYTPALLKFVDQALLSFLEITLTFVYNRDILIFFVINAPI